MLILHQPRLFIFGFNKIFCDAYFVRMPNRLPKILSDYEIDKIFKKSEPFCTTFLYYLRTAHWLRQRFHLNRSIITIKVNFTNCIRICLNSCCIKYLSKQKIIILFYIREWNFKSRTFSVKKYSREESGLSILWRFLRFIQLCIKSMLNKAEMATLNQWQFIKLILSKKKHYIAKFFF